MGESYLVLFTVSRTLKSIVFESQILVTQGTIYVLVVLCYKLHQKFLKMFATIYLCDLYSFVNETVLSNIEP